MCVHVEAGSQPWSETTLHFEGPELTNDLVWLASQDPTCFHLRRGGITNQAATPIF